MSGEPKTLADVHFDAVLLVALIKGIEHMSDYASGDRREPIACAISEALEAARMAGQSIVNELEFLSGISPRPGEAAA